MNLFLSILMIKFTFRPIEITGNLYFIHIGLVKFLITIHTVLVL